MKRSDLYAESILVSAGMVKRFLPGFDDTNCTRQAPGLPNHVAWCLGHLGVVMSRVAHLISGKEVPQAEFVEDQSQADRTRYVISSVVPGSSPVAAADAYPAMARCLEIFDASAARLAEAFATASDEVLDRKAQLGPFGEIPLGGLAARMTFHNGVHCGQIVDLRRALDLPSVLGPMGRPTPAR